jgi:signal peptidase I
MDIRPETRPPEPTKRSSFWSELVSYALFALIVVVPIRMWVAQPFVVNGSSMDTTFADGEYLIVDELTYRFQEPERGAVLIFKYPQDPSKYFIKRLIGLPGETVVVKNDKVTIINKEHPTGMTLVEPYLHSRTFGNVSTTLGQGEYFVMGDNRIVSSDSRVWGPLPKEDVIGRPIVRLLPLGRIDVVPGEIASTTLEKARD